jgi:hypothetical protein
LRPAWRSIGMISSSWPISNPMLDKNKQVNLMLSGKQAVIDNLGGFNDDLSVTNWNSDADLTIILAQFTGYILNERVRAYNEGFDAGYAAGQEEHEMNS